MNRRRGVSLVEALFAILIVAIGLLSILVLFPLGAFKMAQAIKDDRCGHVRDNATAIAETMPVGLGLRNDPNVNAAMTAAATQVITLATKAGNLNYDAANNPVYVDPQGVQAGLGNLQGITRISPSYVVTAADIYRWFSLLDDVTFVSDDPNNPPPAAAGSAGPYLGMTQFPDIQANWPRTINRENRFTWAYLLRQPKLNVSSVIDMSLVVYYNRPAVAGGETAFAGITFDPTSYEVTIPANVDIRKGGWIFDATLQDNAAPNPNPEPHGYFYRVVNVTQTGGNTVLELQTRPRQAANGYGVLVVMDNVVEVFEKGPGWKP
jgi:hypothetical protein